jgi:Bardet-Biedl syndrome 5 protein
LLATQMKNVKVRDSKFGQALVIETVPKSGGYVLGFKIDPKETMDYVFKEISSLWQVYSVTPVFGIEFESMNSNGLDKPASLSQA